MFSLPVGRIVFGPLPETPRWRQKHQARVPEKAYCATCLEVLTPDLIRLHILHHVLAPETK